MGRTSWKGEERKGGRGQRERSEQKELQGQCEGEVWGAGKWQGGAMGVEREEGGVSEGHKEKREEAGGDREESYRGGLIEARRG